MDNLLQPFIVSILEKQGKNCNELNRANFTCAVLRALALIKYPFFNVVQINIALKVKKFSLLSTSDTGLTVHIKIKSYESQLS